MGNNIEGNAVRIAVKDEQTQKKMIRIMKEALVELSK
jgi:hypothetical protein